MSYNTDVFSQQQVRDIAIDLSILDRDLTAPPAAVDGDRYIVAGVATGLWVGQEGNIATFVYDEWLFTTANEGMNVYINDENAFVIYDGATWALAPAGDADTLDGLDSTQFLRSDVTDSYTAGTLTFETGTTLELASGTSGLMNSGVTFQSLAGSVFDIDGDVSIADTNIVLDGASTNLDVTGDLSVNTDDIVVDKSSGYVGIGTATPNSGLHVAGSVSMPIRTETGATYAAGDNDYTILSDAVGLQTITIPSPIGIAGRIYNVKKISANGAANRMTVDSAAGTIDGGANVATNAQYKSYSFQSDGANWFIL